MRNIDLRISPAMKRLADSYYQQRAVQIDGSYSHLKIDPIKFVMMREADKSTYVGFYAQWANEKVQARFETYRDAFRKENVVPNEADLSEMSGAFDEIITNLDLSLPAEIRTRLEHLGQQITQDARRDIQSFAQEMRLENIETKLQKPGLPSSVQYTANIYGSNFGPIQHGGEGNAQGIDGTDDEIK